MRLLHAAPLIASACLVVGCNFPKNELVGDWDGGSSRMSFTNDDTYVFEESFQHPSGDWMSGCIEEFGHRGTYQLDSSGGCSNYNWSSGACESYSTESHTVSLTASDGYSEIRGCDDPADNVARVELGPDDIDSSLLWSTVNFYNDGTAEMFGDRWTQVE